MYFRSPVAAYIRAQSGGDMKSASHHHHSISLPGIVYVRGEARTVSSTSLVGWIIAWSFFNMYKSRYACPTL